MVSLLTSLLLNSVQSIAIKSPVHTKCCDSEILESFSGSHDLPQSSMCAAELKMLAALPELLTEGNSPKTVVSELGSHG